MRDISIIVNDMVLEYATNRWLGCDADSEIDLNIGIIVNDCVWGFSSFFVEYYFLIELGEQRDSLSLFKKFEITDGILNELQ